MGAGLDIHKERSKNDRVLLGVVLDVVLGVVLDMVTYGVDRYFLNVVEFDISCIQILALPEALTLFNRFTNPIDIQVLVIGTYTTAYANVYERSRYF